MNQRERNSNPKENPCHICGSQEFIWGRSVGGTSDWVYFRPDGGWPGSGEALRTRKCRYCGNVEFFANTEY